MPDGGILTIDTHGVTVDEAYAASFPGAQTGSYMQLRVSDTGTGMTEDVLERAFEPFFTTKPKGEGSGLGLATVYGIVNQSRGHITIDSETGKGTTVRIFLPRVEEQAERLSEDPAVDLHGGETVRRGADWESRGAAPARVLA